MLLLGGVALLDLPVAQYPPITPPTVQVTTRYPGASARTVVDTVALPIEQQVNGVEGMIYMQSTSASDGTYSLNVTFEIGTDPDFAQILVQNRVASALAALPQPVQAQGVTTAKRSASILEIITLTSPDGRYDSLFLSNYATINLKDAISRLPGIGNVTIFGAAQYAMRIWLDPDALQARGLVPSDVIQAVQQQNEQVTAGQIGMPPAPQQQAFQYTVNVRGRIAQAAEFEDIIVKAEAGEGGRITRVRDVARVELGAQSYNQIFRVDGQPSAGLAISQLPEANALDVAAEVSATMERMSKSFPQGVTYAIPFDTTRFVQASIDEVWHTLGEAAVLVLIVILVFLQDWRATLVPATTVPISIIGTFAAMAALGFSINLMTLFAIVLSIGIVVDDAIVIVEGVTGHIEQGMPAKQAAIRAMEELLGPIIGITLVLISVFLPAAFLPGLTGQLYRQFALVIAVTALISAINAATLKPTQCALWLRPPPPRRNAFYRGFNRAFALIERWYVALVGRMVARAGAMVCIGIILVGLAIFGLARLPTGFLPIEDQGYLLVAVQLPDGASLQRTQKALTEVTRIAHNTPGVERVVTIAGVSALDNNATLANAGVAYVILEDWSERGAKEGLLALYTGLQAALERLSDGVGFVLVPPAIQGIGNASGFTMQVELRDSSFDLVKLENATQAVVKAAGTQSELRHLSSSFRAEVPQVFVDIDRVAAETLQVPVGAVFDVIETYLGSSYIGQLNRFGRTFQVYAQADAADRADPEAIRRLRVRNAGGDMVPVGAFADVRSVTGPSLISLYNLYPTATIQGAAAPGFSSGQALALMEQIAAQTLPPGMDYEWTAMSFQEKQVGAQAYYVFALALTLVWLVLAAQYESWTAPGAVILAVPLALLGTVATLSALGVANNLYVQIGLVLLIALGSKNAILIVEYARELAGKSIHEAAVEAARRRFRPILMTSFAFILGVLPLVLASGAGASARKSIGITVFSGMLASTCLAVLFVPPLFVVLRSFDEWRVARKTARKA
ncbi:MAG: efflux RND transporter permease subunit [Nitrococcus sp.]|nr:efflux RND transporter permease subunit [Nitrococcus sp.]